MDATQPTEVPREAGPAFAPRYLQVELASGDRIVALAIDGVLRGVHVDRAGRRRAIADLVIEEARLRAPSLHAWLVRRGDRVVGIFRGEPAAGHWRVA